MLSLQPFFLQLNARRIRYSAGLTRAWVICPITILRLLVLTWFPNAPPAIVSPLSILCDPYLNIFRGLIPPLGGTLDLSPILAFLVLNAFTSTASALLRKLVGPELEEQSLGISSYLPLLMLFLIIAIAMSCYLDQSFTRFDPYWIHRVGGSSTGILILLFVLAFVLKFKAL
ncbi:hypothetical protein K7X08_029583 [Anisodus acutangulus]|uniref:Uncharacterized protein n=1 Tax=Anisodus acutangulus TaxID=402998 RepID=A0A9Q1QUW6_9SOLA|nr:hypothetical protein K7X08_029583 [Anisodus acutangulus]